MLMFCAWPFSTACWSCSEPMPRRSPAGSDHRRAAPVRMGRRREDRLVEHVFPITGELLFGDDAGCNGMLAPAGAGDDDPLAKRGGRRLTDFKRRHVELGERLHQPESGFLVVAEDVTGHRAPVVQREPERVRLSDQVTDGQNEAVAANDDAITGALSAECVRRKGVGRHGCAQRHHAREREFEIVGVILRLRLHGGRHLPVAQGCHLIPSSQTCRTLPCQTPRRAVAVPAGASPFPAGYE